MAKRMLSNQDKSIPILEGIDEAQAYVDWPVNLLAPELDEQYPDSLFVLTYRNPDDIALSWCRMCHAMVFQKADYHRKAEEARTMYHNAFELFHQRPDKMLVLDTSVKGTSNMKRLAKFLGTESPTMDWPHAFNHREWYKGS